MVTEATLIFKVMISYILRFARRHWLLILPVILLPYFWSFETTYSEYSQRAEPRLEQIIDLPASPSELHFNRAYATLEPLVQSDPSIMGAALIRNGEVIRTSLPWFRGGLTGPIEGADYVVKSFGTPGEYQIRVMVLRGQGLLLKMLTKSAILASGFLVILFLKLVAMGFVCYLALCWLCIPKVGGKRLVDAHPEISYGVGAGIVMLLVAFVLAGSTALAWLLHDEVGRDRIARNEFSINGVFYISESNRVPANEGAGNYVINRKRVSEQYVTALSQLLDRSIQESIAASNAESLPGSAFIELAPPKKESL